MEDKKKKYKYEVEKEGEYIFKDSFSRGQTDTDGKIVKTSPRIFIKHIYCGSEYVVETTAFINQRKRCGKCCGSYEKSFAYHIEQELKQDLNNIWDFEKNTVNPYHISKSSNIKVWIKCQEKDYHGSYDIRAQHYVNAKSRCPLCSKKTGKVHPLDSFGYYHLDKAMSWYPNNVLSPFRVSCGSGKKLKFICETCEEVFESRVADVVQKNSWCPYCSQSKGEKRIRKWLEENNFLYICDQPYFKDLVSENENMLRPDFIIEKEKIWIEYDGEFHYRDVHKDGSYKVLKHHDKLKDNYAKEHGWKMIRIPYWDFDRIEELLKCLLNKNGRD